MADINETFSRIIEQMADGNAAWEMPWHGKNLKPVNIAHGRAYSGINHLILTAKSKDCGYTSRYWGTFNQWRKIRQGVRRGQKATTLVIPRIERNQQGEEVLTGFKRFWVFNGDQVSNRNEDHPDMFGHAVDVMPKVETFINGLNAEVRVGGQSAYYRPSEDFIQMPPKEAFLPTQHSTATQNWYSTLLHELVHWSGHTKRLNRESLNQGAVTDYAFEELIAELGAAFLCAEFELEDVPRKDHAQYLNSWLAILDDKPVALWKASSLAQLAIAYLLQVKQEEPEHDDSIPSWFTSEPVQVDLLSPQLLGTGRK